MIVIRDCTFEIFVIVGEYFLFSLVSLNLGIFGGNFTSN